MENNRPKIGVAVIIKRKDKVLLGKRISLHGKDSWGFPGGHLEFCESIEECARREIEEETGLIINNFTKGTFTNDIFSNNNKHYVTIFMITDLEQGEPEIKEPEKCEEWKWFKWSELPQPLFLPIQNLLKDGFNLFD